MFFFYQYTRLNKFQYKFFLHYNDNLKQVVVSFGAPSVDNHNYVQMIYRRGWSLIRLYKIRVEKEFRIIYFTHLRKTLLEKVNQIKKSGRANYRFIFTGYSLGGSIAVLAGFDLTRSKIVNNQVNRSTVYTYGGLRIGDKNFVAVINKTLPLWRVVKQNDFIVRIPNCFFSAVLRSWRCLTAPVIRRKIQTRHFKLGFYVRNYVRVPLMNQHHQNVNGNRGMFTELSTEVENKSEEKSEFELGSENSNERTSTRDLLKMPLHHNERKPRGHNGTTVQPSSNPESNHRHHNERNVHRHHGHSGTSSQSSTPQSEHRLNNWVLPKTVPAGSLNKQVRTYIKYVYYTQPLGREVFYNNAMTTFARCTYVRGVSSCEKRVQLPQRFTAAAHKTYYGVNFDQC
jgi:hypothetical protein